MGKRYSTFKFQVVKESLTGDKTPGQMTKTYGIHPNTLRAWKETFPEKGPELFSQTTCRHLIGVSGGCTINIGQHGTTEIIVTNEHALTSVQEDEFLQLAIQCFPGVTAEEAEEDFCCEPVVRVLAYRQEELVAGAEVFRREVEYEGRAIVVGGFGPFVREDLRNRGIGTGVCRTAMDYLQEQGCDVAFLAIGSEEESGWQYHARLRFYERLGFALLDRPILYANARGELLESEGGLIAPLCSQELCERILHGESPFSLAPEPGYW
jgi:GNAT superfamily N-acetyltransferase